MSITPFPSQGQYPWYDQLEQWGADTQAAAESAELNADGLRADVATALSDSTAASAAAIAAAGLVDAPAGDAVLAAISEGGAARGELNAAIGPRAKLATDVTWRGICVRGASDANFTSTRFTTELFQIMDRTKADTVEIVWNVYQPTLTSNGLTSFPTSLATIRDYVRLVRSKGKRAFVKPHVESNEAGALWRANIDPTNPDAWFTSYGDWLVQVATMCQEESADMFCVGSEYYKLVRQYPDKWRALIERIRAVYTGPITYAAGFNTAWGDEAHDVKFWDMLDFVSVNFYARVPHEIDPAVTQEQMNGYIIQDTQLGDPLAALDELAARTGKNIFFGEIGIPEVDKASITQEWISKHMRAVLQMTSKRSWQRGAFVWVVDPWDRMNDFWGAGTLLEEALRESFEQEVEPARPDATGRGMTWYTYKQGFAETWQPIATIKLPRTDTSASMRVRVEGLTISAVTQQQAEIYLHVGAGATNMAQWVECTSDGTLAPSSIGYTISGGVVTLWLMGVLGQQRKITMMEVDKPGFVVPVHLGSMQDTKPAGLIESTTAPKRIRATARGLNAGVVTLDFTKQAFLWRAEVNGNLTLNLVAGPAGQSMEATVEITQDSVGYRNVSFGAGIQAQSRLVSKKPGSVSVINLLWNGASWSAWAPTPTVDEYPATYPEGIAASTNLNRVRRTGNSVTVTFDVIKASANMAANETLLTLHPDVRPGGAVFGYGRLVTDTDANEGSSFVVLASGVIALRRAATGGKAFGASITYDLT